MIVKRVEALSKFLDSDDGKNLLAGVKRASNILKIEEKKDGRSYDGNVNTNILIQGEERELSTAINGASARARRQYANTLRLVLASPTRAPSMPSSTR